MAGARKKVCQRTLRCLLGWVNDMGPILLFDKSFLQSLAVDESVWLDNFFTSNICPVFFVETLADLNKVMKTNRTVEQELRIISEKTPEMRVSVNAFHKDLCIAELFGQKITMDCRPIVPHGIPVRKGDQKGIVFEPSPEAKAFARWQNEEFLELERDIAKSWRKSVENSNFNQIIEEIKKIGVLIKKCKNLEEAKRAAEKIIDDRNSLSYKMKLVFYLLDIPVEYFQNISYRWGKAGCPPLNIFSPFAYHVLSIELFFYISIYSELISGERKSNKTDISYLFYLPFCHLFVSTDRLHKRCAPLFLNECQEFLWGNDLKADLKKIDNHYNEFPESEKEKGLHAFATHPPLHGDYLTTRLWDKYCPAWRDNKNQNNIQEVDSHEIKQWINDDNLTVTRLEEECSIDNIDAMVLKRNISQKKGKWWQVGKDIALQSNPEDQHGKLKNSCS